MENSIPGNSLIRNGFGLMVINNLAISVEGFITDLLIAKLDNNHREKPVEVKELEYKTWENKRKLFNKNI